MHISSIAHSQTKDSVFTKIFFEGGFEKTQVYVIGAGDTLLSKRLSTNYNIGYALILKIKDKKYSNLQISTGTFSRRIQIHDGRFYRIMIRDKMLIIEEVDEEPYYM